MDLKTKTDVGDYMKTFACTAVMMQSVLGLAFKTNPSNIQQTGIGIVYNLVKFTAPAFIFGILYTTIRTTDGSSLKNYPNYIKKQWHAQFIPTIWWTLAYLLIFPNVQQISRYFNLKSFLWQFINGNAAPHLWYNTMMLQFIILMPIFWTIANFVGNSSKKAWQIGIITFVFYFIWIYFYDLEVFHGVHMKNWYLLDRIFISFIIYGVLGILTWKFHFQIKKFLQKTIYIYFIAFLLIFIWTNWELTSFGYPVKLTNAPYYKPSMSFYSLTIITLIAILAFRQIRLKSFALKIFHFLATYAYRAYLSNYFWL